MRKHHALMYVGLGAIGASLLSLALPVLSGLSALGGLLFFSGFVGALGGAWIPWRLSFAAHRMWGVYERGFVASFYQKGGMVAFIPWSAIARVRQRRLRAAWADPVEGAWLFRAEEAKPKYGGIHRITESDLRAFFGYTPEESKALRDEIQEALRQVLPPEKISVELELAGA